MEYSEIIDWLLLGDVSVQYQVHRDLLGSDRETLLKLKSQIAKEGFGKIFMDNQNPNGHWGLRFYQPKWISTHYTLLDLRCIEINSLESLISIVDKVLDNNNNPDDKKIVPDFLQSDICITGMFLNYATYFGANAEKLKSLIDCIVDQHMTDGGFNCRLIRGGAVHSSLHSTISVLEGITEYINQGYSYKKNELIDIKLKAIEFILQHRLYKSDKTGEIISKGFTMLSYPSRWRYDILRALDYLRYENIPYDVRMSDALDLLLKKRNKDGMWNVQAKHAGKVHFDMELVGKPSRWNTLRALRVLKFYDYQKR